jgi:UDP-glucose 4-epimerase
MTSPLVLIIGATGMSGGAIGRRLVGAGVPVRAFLRPGQNKSGLAFHPQEVAFGDLLQRDELDAAVAGVGVVLYFASTTVPATSQHDPGIEYTLTLPALNNVLMAMERNGVGRIVFPSSGGTVYGPRTTPAVETSPLLPQSGYGLGKVMAEQAVQFFERTAGIRHDILRITNVYGSAVERRSPQGVIDVFLDDAIAGRSSVVWGGLANERDYLFVDDLADAVLALLAVQDRPSGIYNLGASQTHSLEEVLAIIGATTAGRHQFTVDAAHAASGVSRSAVTCAHLTQAVGWQAKWSLAEGIAETWRRKQVGARLS